MIVFLLGVPEISFSQTTNLSDSIYNSNTFNTIFYNDINTANLNSLLNYSHNFKKFGVSVGNYYLSNVSKLDKNFFRDYNNFHFLLFYKLKDNLDAGLGFQNKFLTDDKNVETNKNNSSYVFTNLDYRVNQNVYMNTRLGIKKEDQIGEINTGFSGIVTAQADNYLYRDYLTNGKMIVFYENLIQKQNHNYEFNANIYKRFSKETDNTGLIKIYNQRNDVYFPATQSVINQFNVKNNIVKRVENFIQAGDYLNYSFNRNLIFALGGFFINRDITKEFKYRASSSNILFENVYDTKMTENNLEFSGALNYNWYKFDSRVKLLYNERSENHILINTEGLTQAQIIELEKAERNKNNNSKRTSLMFDCLYYLSNTNSFGFAGSTSLLKYDTDFDENFDDRDERETLLSTVYTYDNLINFKVDTRFDVILSKLSYIFSQKSANNYKNRIFKLTSESAFYPVKEIYTRNFVQVLANYTVYDYEDIISQVQSFSYRQLYIKDSTIYNFNRRLKLDFQGELKYYEQGQFNNDEFSVKPIAFFIEQLYTPKIYFFLNEFLEVGAGYKFFMQERFQYENTERQLVNTYKVFGPVGKINFYLNNNSIVNFTAGIDYIKYQNPPQENTSVNLKLDVIWNM